MFIQAIIERLIVWIRLQIFTIRQRDTDFDKLGVRVDPPQKPGLEMIVEAFRQGYNLTLADDDLGTLTQRMADKFEPNMRGFAYEGVGMSLTLLDWFGDRERAQRLMTALGRTHEHMVGLGVGFALARLPWVRGGAEAYARRFPPGMDGMIFNGYGFHEGCFKSRGAIDRCPRPNLSPQALRCFDHGLGRAMWFVNGASPRRIRETLARIPTERHPDLWAGMGTACCFAGRAYADFAQFDAVITELKSMAGTECRDPFGLGVMLAAMLQVRNNTHTRWVQRAAETIIGITAAELGATADKIWQDTTQDRSLAQAPFATYEKAGTIMIEAIAARVKS